MAVILNVVSAQYSVGSHDLPISVAANITQLMVTLTRESWPAGAIGSAKVTWSDGSFGSASFVGGTRLDKFGQPRTFERVSVSKPRGITDGTVSVVVLQTLTTAVLVEAS